MNRPFDLNDARMRAIDLALCIALSFLLGFLCAFAIPDLDAGKEVLFLANR